MPTTLPKIGDLIPGSTLKYEAEDIANLGYTAPTPTPTTLPVPKYGDSVTDSMGRVGVAKFDPNTGMALTVPTPTVPTTPENQPMGTVLGTNLDTGTPAGYEAYLKGQIAPVDEGAIRQQKMAEIQAEIDAQNAVYAGKLSEARVAGRGRLGESTAIQARRGLIGSDFGAAQTETTRAFNVGQEASIEAEKQQKISQIRSRAKTDATAEIAAKRLAQASGWKEYSDFIKNQGERKVTNTQKVVASLIANGSDPTMMDTASLAEYAKIGITAKDIADEFAQQSYKSSQEEKKRLQEQADKLALEKPTTMETAQGIMQYNPATKKWEKTGYTKYEKPEAGASTGLAGLPISDTAKNYITLIDNGTMTVDEVMTKLGSSKAGLALKNEVANGIAQGGGKTKIAITKLEDMQRSVNEILSGDTEYFGVSIAPRFKAINPYYASFQTQLDSLIASLTSENTGLLKGPMSDKDIQFLKDMSSGLDISMDEKTAVDRLKKIQTRIAEKLAPLNIAGGTGSAGIAGEAATVMKSPDGTQEVNIADLTPAEIKEAKDAGWI